MRARNGAVWTQRLPSRSSTISGSPLRATRIVFTSAAFNADTRCVATGVLPGRMVIHSARPATSASSTAFRRILPFMSVSTRKFASAVTQADYTRALLEIAALRPAVDRFFTEVFVMVEDPALRQARLALLADLRDTVRAIADLSSIAGPQA